MDINQLMKSLSKPEQKPGEWINVHAVKHTLKCSGKFFGMVACIAGLSREESRRWNESVPPGPSNELSCNRLAWLKWLATCTKMCLNVIENEIKKIESEKSESEKK